MPEQDREPPAEKSFQEFHRDIELQKGHKRGFVRTYQRKSRV